MGLSGSGRATLNRLIDPSLDEAIRIGDRIAIMKDGAIVQTGTAEEIVRNPADQYVADFEACIARIRLVKAASVMMPVVGYHNDPLPAMLVAVISGIPPMLWVTTPGLNQVPRELVELGAASRATPFQTLTKSDIPSARKTLLLGLDQCIFLSLAMAGLVGAGGLGAEVTRGLTRMEMGLGLRSGLAIVVVAIFLDRISREALEERP